MEKPDHYAAICQMLSELVERARTMKDIHDFDAVAEDQLAIERRLRIALELPYDA